MIYKLKRLDIGSILRLWTAGAVACNGGQLQYTSILFCKKLACFNYTYHYILWTKVNHLFLNRDNKENFIKV